MKQSIAAALVAAFWVLPAAAQEPNKAATAQEKQQAACTKQADAKGLKGRDRGQFVTNCMRAAAQPAKK